MVGVRLPVVVAARELARTVLSDVPERWQHTASVANRARELASAVGPGEDPDVLVAAAWLHDIGYGAAAVRSGFHPLDGADFLADHGWPERLSALVAHHSGARFVADALGLGSSMQRYPYELSTVSDALTYADQTVGQYGRRLDLAERMADMLRRHGPQSANARAHPRRAPYLLAVAGRVEARLHGSDLTPAHA